MAEEKLCPEVPKEKGEGAFLEEIMESGRAGRHALVIQRRGPRKRVNNCGAEAQKDEKGSHLVGKRGGGWQGRKKRGGQLGKKRGSVYSSSEGERRSFCMLKGTKAEKRKRLDRKEKGGHSPLSVRGTGVAKGREPLLRKSGAAHSCLGGEGTLVGRGGGKIKNPPQTKKGPRCAREEEKRER